MISRCSDSRDRIMNRSEWSSEKTTDATKQGYRRTSITSIEATRTVFSTATPGNADIRGTSPKQKRSTGGLFGLAVAKTNVVRQLCGDAVVPVV